MGSSAGGWLANWLPKSGWRSWLAGGLAAAVIMALVVARLLGAHGSHQPASVAAPTGGTASHSTGPDDGLLDNGGAPASSAPPAAVTVAQEFVRAWANHAGLSPSQWIANVSRYADDSFTKELRLTDPQRVPATHLIGESGDVHTVSVSGDRAVLSVATDAGRVLVSCLVVSGSWRVTDLDNSIGPDSAGVSSPHATDAKAPGR